MSYNPFDLTAKLDYKPRLLARIKWWFRRRKYIKERAQKCWSSYDVWDFDTYLARTISTALEFLAQNHMSHPSDMTEEEWEAKLRAVSECFRVYYTELPCPAYELYRDATVRITNPDKSISVDAPDHLFKAWREEELANHEFKMKKLREGFDLLYEVYPNLWD